MDKAGDVCSKDWYIRRVKDLRVDLHHYNGDEWNKHSEEEDLITSGVWRNKDQ